MDRVLPKVPHDGAAVCFCTPSLPIRPNRRDRIDRRQACVAWAEAVGMKPVFTPHFAAHDEVDSVASVQMRVDDFNTALDYPFVSIVGGGGGAVSLLDGIDYDKARRNRPVVMGMSDQTKIVNALAARAGLATYYGPNGGFGHWYQADSPRKDFFTARTIEQIRSAVWQGRSDLSPTGGEESASWEPLDLAVETQDCPAVLEGTCVAGHWHSLAEMMAGTPYVLPPEGPMLVFLEALHDCVLPNLNALERMRVLGYFRQGAILCGGPFWEKPGQAVQQWLRDYCRQRALPLVAGLRFGHFHPISVVPVGLSARFDVATRSLTWEVAS